jgi:hypothetical protein
MSVTPRSDLAGVLPVVISGGRPALAQRSTARLLPALAGVTADPVWLVRDDQAAEYERDRWELAVYPLAAAEEYAAAHWTAPEPYRPGAFLGAFTGREWACRLAEERGCWAVLQLDDNLACLYAFTGYGICAELVTEHGGLGLYADILTAVTLATNSRMTGAALDSVPRDARVVRQVARAGFPYSLFIERTGPGREPWHGPTEDDILHAWQYAVRADTATAAVLTPLGYHKENTARTGMRAHYDHGRAAGLQRAAPEMASIQVLARHSNGRGEPRVFHRMTPAAIRRRAPLTVTNPALYGAVADALDELAADVGARYRDDRRAYWMKRAARWPAPPTQEGKTP